MIYITGDTHGDFGRVVKSCEQMETEKEDVLIILGDAGINYYGGKRDQKTKAFLESLPITIFFYSRKPRNAAADDSNLSRNGVVRRYGLCGR